MLSSETWRSGLRTSSLSNGGTCTRCVSCQYGGANSHHTRQWNQDWHALKWTFDNIVLHWEPETEILEPSMRVRLRFKVLHFPLHIPGVVAHWIHTVRHEGPEGQTGAGAPRDLLSRGYLDRARWTDADAGAHLRAARARACGPYCACAACAAEAGLSAASYERLAR